MVITEVEDEIDSGELLEHLSRDPQEGAAKIRRWIPDRACETVCPAGDVAVLADDLEFVFVVCYNLGEFFTDVC
jgi:hypothetical protein